jgi:enolase
MSMSKITDIKSKEILDSRGRPTLEVTVYAEAAAGTFQVPSGASTGSAEACELRDKDGHMKLAMENIEEIIKPSLLGLEVTEQEKIDGIMIALDGTGDKSRLGGNAMIGVSIAAAKASASAEGRELFEYLRTLSDIKPSRQTPYLYLNYINGGKHAASPLSFQEHIIVPQTDSIGEAMEIADKVEVALGAVITKEYGAGAGSSMGDEGGYIIPESDYEKPFYLLKQAIIDSGCDGLVRLATDVAASSFYKNGSYLVGGKTYSAKELRDIFIALDKEFHLLSIEDPFFEGSFEDFADLKNVLEAKIVGDDLTVTNSKKLAEAVAKNAIDAIIIKPNQIGTLTETLSTMKEARDNGLDCIVSHRSGETGDSFIADLAYAFGCFGLKAGALRRPERAVKYQRLADIAK